MFCKFFRKKKTKTEKKSTDLCFPPDIYEHIDHHHFTSDQSKVQSYKVEGPLIDSYYFTSDQSKVQSDEVKGPLIDSYFTSDQFKVQSYKVEGPLIDSYHFNSDQSKVQSDEVEGPLIDSYFTSDQFKVQSYKVEGPLIDSYHFTSDQSKVQSDEVEGPLIGDHETQESEGGEADLHKYLVGCKKNPGHRQFIPVDTFTLKHLPKGYKDKDLCKYIKATADLAVRVGVEMSSPKRPKFWPETTRPYPFYNMSERRNLRTGSGRVWNVNMFQDGVTQDGVYGRTAYTKCWCRKCEGSNSASNVWWEFYVNTARHVVFDDIEANHTTLRLFYDRDECPVVSVNKVSVRYVNIEYDVCRLNCVTCDKTLGNKLREMYVHYVKVWRKVYNKYRASRSKHQLTFIVSHPHGCSKQVSVGQWNEILKVYNRCKFIYTTCTCPGSSGAQVHCLGYTDHWVWSDLVHSGSLKSGLNYSGVASVL